MSNNCTTIDIPLNINNELTNAENFDESEIVNYENSNDASIPALSTNDIENSENFTNSISKLTSKIKRPKEYNDKEWEAEAVYYLYINSSTNSLRSNANSNTDNSINYQPLINGFSRNSNSYTSLTSLDNTLEKRPNRKKKRGFAYRSRIDSEYKCFQDHAEVCYRLGDHVFVETFQPTEPYFIGCINQFKMNKREQLYVKLARYYRPNDVPEMSYSLIIQDRIDQGHFNEAIRCVQSRELFSSDTVAIFPVSQLRGKCKVKLVKDIRAILPDSLSINNNNNFLNISTSNGIYQNESFCLNDIKNNYNNSFSKEKESKNDLITKKNSINDCNCSSNGKRALNKTNVSITTTNLEKLTNQAKKQESCLNTETSVDENNLKELQINCADKSNDETLKNRLFEKNTNKIDCEVPLCFVSASGSNTNCIGCCEIPKTSKNSDNNSCQPEVLELLKEEDTFFTCLNFNQENNRLASFAGEIRVGASFQAKLPPPAVSSMCDEPDRDELLYRPGHLCYESEMNYVKAARTFRSFKVNCNKQMTSIEKAARIGDLLMDKALITLHYSGYNIKNALEKMRENDENLDFECSYFNIEDVKKFGKGIKTSGKNFNKINRELLPHYTRDQLVNFYYLWKRSRDAIRPRPLGRQKNPTVAAVSGVGRRGANGKTNNGNSSNFNRNLGSPNGNSTKNYGPKLNSVLINGMPNYEELLDYASASDTESENLDNIQRACHHCFTSKSRNWHHAGRNRLLMCESCRLFYKKYADLKQVDRPSTVPLCLSKASVSLPQTNKDDNENDATSTYSIKTRGAIGRKERRQRTPTILDVYGSNGGTPVKNDMFLTENSTPEKRLTPQRNAKSKKRLHRGSSSGNVESTPCLRSKRSKTDSVTPSPSPTLLCGNVEKTNDVFNTELMEKNLNNSSLNFSDELTLSIAIKKELTDKNTNQSSIDCTLNSDEKKSSNNNLSINNCTKSLAITPTMARIKPEIKKPIAKVEPLDPNESVKDSVKSAFSVSLKSNKIGEKINENVLSKKNLNQSNNKIGEDNQQFKKNIEKMEVTDEESLNSRSITPVNNNTIFNENDQQQNEESEDASSLGTEDNSPLELIKEKDGCVDTVIHRFLKRRLKRLSQVTCARTDISVDDTYAQKILEDWRRKQKQQQQIIEQQKQNQTLSISALNNLTVCGTNGSLSLQQRHQQDQQQITALSVATNNCLTNHQQQIASSRKHSEIINHSFENNTSNIVDTNAALRAAALFSSNQNINGIPSTAALAALTAVHQQQHQQQQSSNQLPPNAAAIAAAMQNMSQIYPRIAAMFAVNQQAVIASMVANFEQQQKMELRRQQQQLQQQTTQSQQQRHHQINGAASKHQQRSTSTGQKNSLSNVSLSTGTSEINQTPFLAASTLEQQRLSFLNTFNQQQAILAQQQNHQQQQNLLGFPTSLTELAMLIDRDGVDQRASLERLQLEYHQKQLQQQTNQNNMSVSNTQQLQQQLLLAATMGNPMLNTAGTADSKQLQTFLSIIQQQQAALQQQQAQQQQAAAAAVVAQQKQQQLQVAAAAATVAAAQQPQQQQQKQVQQQQQLLTAMTNSLPPQFQQQMAQLMQQHQQQQMAEIMRRFQQEQQTSGSGGRQ